MANIKSHKTIEQIAKKHGVDIPFIEKQLEIGEPIEHEHTKDNDLARDIALQHLGEFPDYYTRLKKMEKSAKKSIKENFDNKRVVKELEIGLKKLDNISYSSIDKLMRRIMKKHHMSAKELHYAFKDKHNKTPDEWIKELKEETVGSSLVDLDSPVHMPPIRGVHVDYEKRYCPKCKKDELRSECKYGAKYWDMFSIPSKLSNVVKTQNDVEEGVSFDIKNTKKLTGAQEKLHKMSSKQREQLPKEMVKKLMGPDLPPVNLNKEQTVVDKILDEIEEGKGLWYNIRKRREKGLPRKKPGQKGYPETLNIEETDLEEGIEQARKNVGASKCWKNKKLGNPKTKMKGGKEVPNCVPENLTIEDADGNTFAEVIDIIKPEPIKGFKSQVDEATRMQAQTGNVIAVTLMWRGKYYSIKMFFPQVKLPTRNEINDELQKVYPGSKVVYHSVSEIQPGQPLIQAFGPQGGNFATPGLNRNYVKPMGEEVELEEKGPSLSVGRGEKLPVSRGGGLTEKGREKYNRATGSNLQAPVTGDVKPGSKAAKRRKAFCSRSRSWKGERGLAARRRWKC